MALGKKVVVVFSKKEKKFAVMPGQGILSKNVQMKGVNRDILADGSFYLVNVVDKPGLAYYLSFMNDASLAASAISVEKAKELCSGDTALDTLPLSSVTGSDADTPAPKPELPKDRIPAGVHCDKKTWQMLLSSLDAGLTPFLMGPRGCGKSTIARALAEARGWHFTQFDMGQAFKPQATFLGTLILNEEGHTDFVTSEFYTAFTSDQPTLIFLDEITRCPMQSQNMLMTILAPNTAYIYNSMTGERVYAGKDVHFVTAGNLGAEYSGTSTLDAAFSDRFVKFMLDYLAPASETRLLLESIPGLNEADAASLVKAANLLRNAQAAGTLSVGYSTRQALAAGKLLAAGWGLRDVVNTVILNNYAEYDETKTAKNILASL